MEFARALNKKSIVRYYQFCPVKFLSGSVNYVKILTKKIKNVKYLDCNIFVLTRQASILQFLFSFQLGFPACKIQVVAPSHPPHMLNLGLAVFPHKNSNRRCLSNLQPRHNYTSPNPLVSPPPGTAAGQAVEGLARQPEAQGKI